jgi:hypothetical protein
MVLDTGTGSSSLLQDVVVTVIKAPINNDRNTLLNVRFVFMFFNCFKICNKLLTTIKKQCGPEWSEPPCFKE